MRTGADEILLRLEEEIARKELQLEEYVDLRSEFDIKKEEDLLRLLRRLRPIALEGYRNLLPPPPIPRRPWELPAVLTDWDLPPAGKYTLDARLYVSEPSCLNIEDGYYALLKQSAVGMPLAQGRIESYYRHTGARTKYVSTRHSQFMFRNQAPDGTLAHNKTYAIQFYGPYSDVTWPQNGALFMYQDDTNPVQIDTRSLAINLDPWRWYQIRCTFWVSQGVLIVRLEYFNGTDWVKLCNDFTDTANRWADSPTNRVGVGAFSYYRCWWDDTIIYAPV